MQGVQLMNTHDLDRIQAFHKYKKKKKVFEIPENDQIQNQLLTSIHNIYKANWIAV